MNLNNFINLNIADKIRKLNDLMQKKDNTRSDDKAMEAFINSFENGFKNV